MTNKRTAILEAAIALFSQNGFWNTSTTQITRKAGVGTGTLFNYFENKDALISEVLLKLKLEAIHGMQKGLKTTASVEEQLYHVWKQGVEWAVNNAERCYLMDQLESSEYVTAETYENIRMEYAFLHLIFQQGFKDKVIIDIDEFLLMKTMLLQGRAIFSFIRSREMKKAQAAQMIDLGFRMFWKGITP